MKSRYLLAFSIFLVSACQDSNTQSNGSDSTGVNTRENGGGSKQTADGESNGFWEKLVMNELGDGKGNVAAIVPFPASWKLMPGNSEGITITGPNGIRVKDFPAQSFMYNRNPSLNGAYSAGGQQMRIMPGVEQLIREDIEPWASSRGLQYVKHYEVPEVSKMDKWYSDQLYKAMPSQSEVVAIGTEWKSNDGKPYFILMHLNVSNSQAMQTWYYFCNGLEADPAYFESAVKQYLFGLGNTRYNLQPIIAYNEAEAQRVGQSWASFNARMVQNQANFEASQRAHVNKSNAINDAIMSGWRERNAAGDHNQEQFLDMINEKQNVVNPTTGQGYKVTAGANQYWMNSNGEYISTQLHTYDPNLDKNMNEQKWQQLKQINN